MRCARCLKRIKKAYRHNGLEYGPECVEKAGGVRPPPSKAIKIKRDFDPNEKQMGLF